MRWLLLGFLLFLPVSTEASVLWFTGVEASNMSEFGSVGAGGNQGTVCNTLQSGCSGATCSNILISPTSAKTGCYTAGTVGSSVNPGFVGSKGGLNATTIYTRFYWFMANTTAKVINEPIMGSISVGAPFNVIILMLKTDNTLFWCYQSAASTCTPIASGSTVLAGTTWYLFEIKQVIHASAGGIEVKINGTTEISSFATNTSANNIDFIAYGPFSGNASNIHYYLFDDLMVCDSAYCPQGRTIARQGKAGTPTYDAWTKNSCSGGTIDGCWSDTPFSATSNATSATASAAQTMLVESHLAASSSNEHGSEFLTSGDTVNACKVSVVAKMATASSFSIRRRVNGSDTDTAKTLTTSDAYYDDGIWTTTANLLPGVEIGGVHGAGTNTMTVEDAWLQCDYNAGAIQRKVIQE